MKADDKKIPRESELKMPAIHMDLTNAVEKPVELKNPGKK
jgi:hypothetical protein